MSPRTIKQIDKIKREKESLILDTAIILFSENGFKNTSMEAIAKKAMVSKGNLYNYFDSKEALLRAVLKNGLDQFSDFFHEIQSEINSQEQFEKIIRMNFETLKLNKRFWKLYFNLVSQPSAQKYFSDIMEPLIPAYMNIFGGYFRKRGYKNPEASAMLLGSSMDGISLAYLMMEDKYPLDQVIQELIEKFK